MLRSVSYQIADMHALTLAKGRLTQVVQPSATKCDDELEVPAQNSKVPAIWSPVKTFEIVVLQCMYFSCCL